MKKFICVILIMCLITISLVSCNKQMFDTTYSFNYAYVVWPDGKAEKLAIKSWKDFDGDQIQIKTKNDKTYVFHSVNCVLAHE